MKKLIYALILIILWLPNYGLSKESEKFILTGKFINASKVQCHIYKDLSVNHDSWTLIRGKIFKDIYEIELDINSGYLLIFQDGKQSKHLYIFTKKSDNLIINTDFGSKNTGIVVYDEDFDTYKLRVITPDEVESLKKKGKYTIKKRSPLVNPKREREGITWG